MLQKGVDCCEERSDGIRKVGGICWDLLEFRRCLNAGRIAVPVDIVMLGRQLRCVYLVAVTSRNRNL